MNWAGKISLQSAGHLQYVAVSAAKVSVANSEVDLCEAPVEAFCANEAGCTLRVARRPWARNLERMALEMSLHLDPGKLR